MWFWVGHEFKRLPQSKPVREPSEPILREQALALWFSRRTRRLGGGNFLRRKKSNGKRSHHGIAASDGRFDGKIDTRATGKICHSGSPKVSYSENRDYPSR